MKADLSYDREVAQLTASWCLLVLVDLIYVFAGKYDWLAVADFLAILRILAIGMGTLALIRYSRRLRLLDD